MRQVVRCPEPFGLTQDRLVEGLTFHLQKESPEIDGDVLTLSFPQVGLDVKGKLKGDTIVDEEGKIWVRREGKLIAPSPKATAPSTLTITDIEVRPSREPEVIVPAAPTSTPTLIPSLEPTLAERGLPSAHLSDTPDGPAMTQFPSGTSVVYAIFEYVGMAGERIKVRVYDNYGSSLFEQTQNYTGSGTESVATTTSERYFPDGRYVTNLYFGEYVARMIVWDVGEPVARPIATPTPAPPPPTPVSADAWKDLELVGRTSTRIRGGSVFVSGSYAYQ